MLDKTKLLALSDSISGMTGFGSVTRDILTRLPSKKYKIDAVGYNVVSSVRSFNNIRFLDGQKITNITQHSGGFKQNGFAIDKIMPLLKKLKPDIFWCLLDSFMLLQAGYHNQDLSPAKFVFYFPSDGGTLKGGFPHGCDAVLRKAQFPVAMSKFAQEQVKNQYGIDVDYIPHGIDGKYYKPLKDKIKCKMTAPHGHPKFKDKFIVGSVFRNQPRKSPDILVEAFSKFAKGKDDVLLLLHTDPNDPARGCDLRYLGNYYGLDNKMFFTGVNICDGFTMEQMKTLYNSMDVHVLSTTGEGFGVPTIEAMACGVPVLNTDYTTTKELVLDNKAGLGFRVQREMMGNWNVPRGFGDVDDLAEKLELLYANPKLREDFGTNGVEAVKKYYDYDTIVGPAWQKYFEEKVLK